MSSSTNAFNQEKEINKLWELKVKALEEEIRMATPSKPGRSQSEQRAPMYNPDGEVILGALLAEVKTQPIDWLWPKRIPLGKITILDGDPGMGKSLLALSVAASVSTGQPMPDGTPGKQGGVILIAPEDSAGDTIKPRLKAAGGDPSCVLLLNTLVQRNAEKIKIADWSFTLSRDLYALEAGIKQYKAVLVIVDPLTAVLGKNIDQSRDQNVREVFTPLAQLAERTNCAVLIIRHLSKVGTANLLYRGAGSIGIIAAARLGLIVVQDPDDEQKRILATTKNNLSKQANNLTFQVVENERGVPYIQWLGESNYSLKSLSNGTNLSIQRQDILRVLNNSKGPLALKDIADRTGQDYDRVRKTVHRMLVAKEVASPARGEFTTIDHPSMTKPTDENHNVPAETSETLETSETSETDTACESPKNDEQCDVESVGAISGASGARFNSFAPAGEGEANALNSSTVSPINDNHNVPTETSETSETLETSVPN
jgi:archaellum biogenesis ATPase FlaH/Fe2+ or Zn2+ uptake regulation protein